MLTMVSSNTNGASLAYTYDVLNRLSKVCDNRIAPNCGTAGTTTYSYDAAGNPTGYAYPNTVQTANAFDTQNRLTQPCEATSSPACSASQKLASYAYTLGYAGNRTNVAELNGRNVVYGYDNDYRLQSESITSDPGGNNGAENYTYDAVGNRQTLTSTIPSLPGGMNYFYDANDRLTTDTYDNDGNTISSGGTANTYDFENRILTHGAVSIVYDGDGNRVSETVGSTTTKYLVDDRNPTGYSQVMDELVNGSVTRTYAYGLQRISENQLIGGTWTPSFYGYDGHGNTRFLANSSGAVTDTYTFDAFGAPIASTGTTPNLYLYSGERFDSNLNLYHLRARYYNMLTGRFETMDPGKETCCALRASQVGNIFDPRTLHRYVYAANDPVNRVDPTGRDAPEYVFQLEVDIELRSPLGLEMRATQHVVGKIFACVDLYLADEFYAAAGYDVLLESCIEEVGL
jgi:RHS repeat-associated protein